MVRLFFDTEFTDLKQDCDLISIGIVAKDGDSPIKCFYAESIDFSQDKCSDFVRDRVLPNLKMGDAPRVLKTTEPNGMEYSVTVLGTEEDIKFQLIEWLKQFIPREYNPTEDGKIDVWSDCLAYDWVLFCHLFEDDGGIPDCINYIPFDISTYLKVKNIDPDITREEFASSGSHKGDIEELCEKGADFKHNSLFDAMVIYYCFDTLENL